MRQQSYTQSQYHYLIYIYRYYMYIYYVYAHICAIASKINITPKAIRLSEKLRLTAALLDEI